MLRNSIVQAFKEGSLKGFRLNYLMGKSFASLCSPTGSATVQGSDDFYEVFGASKNAQEMT